MISTCTLGKKKQRKKFGVLRSLLVEGFDGEQIWQEINMEHEPLLSFVDKQISASELAPELLSDEDVSEDEYVTDGEICDDGDEFSEGVLGSDQDPDQEAHLRIIQEQDDDELSDEKEAGMGRNIGEQDLGEDDDDDGSDGDFFADDSKRVGEGNEDVDFFDLDEMNKFADREENDGDDDDDDADNDEEDEFEDELGEGDTDGGDSEEASESEKDPKKLKFDDFFDGPGAKQKQNTIGEDRDDEIQQLSNFEKRQLAMRSKIAEIESKIASPRDWEQIGEVDAYHRPTDSLLVYYFADEIIILLALTSICYIGVSSRIRTRS